jgi:HNH endonuclease
VIAVNERLRSLFDDKFIPEPMSGCWIWIGARNTKRYGVMKWEKKTWRAHRLSWMIHRGEIGVGLGVLHRCDNTVCVNPDHLFLGDQKANMADAAAKGRTLQGIKHPGSKLTGEDVLLIRADRRVKRIIAIQYGVSERVICQVQKRQIWQHIN